MFLVVGQPNFSIPVFKIRPETGDGNVKVVHRNLLLPIGNIPERKHLPDDIPERKHLPDDVPERKHLPDDVLERKNLSDDVSESEGFYKKMSISVSPAFFCKMTTYVPEFWLEFMRYSPNLISHQLKLFQYSIYFHN